MKSAVSGCLISLALAASSQAAAAQSGDVRAGFTYAAQVCSECHAVRPGERVSPNKRAPTFQEVADATGMRELALRVWFQTAHPSMPNVPIRGKEADDVIAYILSLKQQRSAAPAQAALAPSGDVRAGFIYAAQVCSECHAVSRGERVSPNQKAPAFQEVAETSGMTELALRVWFQTPHPSMPNLRIRGKEADDVVAYILSLKQRS